MVTFSVDSATIEHLDRLAQEQHTNRDTLINRALELYFLPEFSEEDVQEGLREIDAGQSSSLEEVMERAKAWNR